MATITTSVSAEGRVRSMDEKENRYISLATHAIGLDHKKPYKRHGIYFYRPYRNTMMQA